MGEFTAWDDPAADAAVREQLGLITRELVETVRPDAVVLAGSFGRGEGAVRRRQGALEFLSDYEVCVVARRLRQRLRLDGVARRLAGRLPARPSLFWVTPGRLRANRLKNLSWGTGPPSVMMYELKAGSRLLYGSAPLAVNPIAPETLPVQEGVYFILNRMIEAVGASLGPESTSRTEYALAKLVLALGDALLIRGGAYHYSCRRRLASLREHYQRLCWPVFTGGDFLELYEAAARMKLCPDQAPRLDSAAVAPATARTLRFLALEEMGFPALAWPEWPRHYLAYCRRAVPPLYRAGPLPLVGNFYENLVSAVKLARVGIRFSPAALLAGPSWRQVVYAAVPAVFFASPLAAQPEAALLASARACLARLVPAAALPPEGDWRGAAGAAFRLWSHIC